MEMLPSPVPPGVLSVPASQTEDSGFLSFSGLKYSPQLLRGQETHRDREWATDFPAQVMGKGQWSRVFVGLSTTVVFNPASGIQEAALRGDGEAVGRRLAPPPFKPEQLHSSLLSGRFHIRCHWKKRVLTA